jgi:hypothetical protein
MNVHVRFFTVAAFAALAALAGAAPLAAQSAPVASDDPSGAMAAFAVPTALPDAPVRAPSRSATVTAPSDGPAASANRGPTLASARVATHAVSAPRGAPPVIQNRSSNRNAVALMAVGGAALVVGAVIGDDAGTLVMLGGAVVGLYGLYLFLT